MSWLLLPLVVFTLSLPAGQPEESVEEVIVQAVDFESAAAAVRFVGGELTHELRIIDAVGARLSERQLARVNEVAAVRQVHPNRSVSVEDEFAVFMARSP